MIIIEISDEQENDNFHNNENSKDNDDKILLRIPVMLIITIITLSRAHWAAQRWQARIGCLSPEQAEHHHD